MIIYLLKNGGKFKNSYILNMSSYIIIPPDDYVVIIVIIIIII